MDAPENISYKMDLLREDIIKAIEQHPWILDEKWEYAKIKYRLHNLNIIEQKKTIIDSRELPTSCCRAALFEARREYKRRHKL